MRNFNINKPYTKKELDSLKKEHKLGKLYFFLFIISFCSAFLFPALYFILELKSNFLYFGGYFMVIPCTIFLTLSIYKTQLDIREYQDYSKLLNLFSSDNEAAAYLDGIKNIREPLIFEVKYLENFVKEKKNNIDKNLYHQGKII